MQSLTIAAGASVSGIELRLAPSAKVRVESTVEAMCSQLDAIQDGVVIVSESMGLAMTLDLPPGPTTVRRTPWKKSESGTRRWPFGPAITASASSTCSGGAMSAEGAALQMLPPSVARVRTWTEPTSAAPSASAW